MDYEQRIFVRLKFDDLLIDLFGTAFEQFFHDLMSLRYADFLPVRTAGKLGDQGADGLALCSGKMYVCYAPEVFDEAKVRRKFRADLANAMVKRTGEFRTFVFVHNDRRGMHPVLTSELVKASTANPLLRFEHMGRRALLAEIGRLDKASAEDILGCPIPVDSLVYGVGMEELAELLDEIAEGFSVFYRGARRLWDEPEDILNDLHFYVLGNMHHPPRVQRNAWVILAYFFERCHIFEAPPAGWGLESAGTGFPG
ncbi:MULTISPECIES: hypothetical protein [unclassified Frankia]|uniref:hypothetical protein n=1 Tax=unclassified Frankia TaxID=2632575 RepID=UPI002AD246E5|nr:MULTISPECIES: hypothetical protein [unclassified Frankia]